MIYEVERQVLKFQPYNFLNCLVWDLGPFGLPVPRTHEWFSILWEGGLFQKLPLANCYRKTIPWLVPWFPIISTPACLSVNKLLPLDVSRYIWCSPSNNETPRRFPLSWLRLKRVWQSMAVTQPALYGLMGRSDCMPVWISSMLCYAHWHQWVLSS